jgi:two-component system probable response regulator PhcQ
MSPYWDYRKFAVLFVDDEEQARKYFRMAFEQDFQILTAAGVDEAWQLITAGSPPIGLVIADQRMPRRVGTELLGQVRRSYPEIVRMLTTAYADLDAAVEAVNSGAIFKYLVKPWDIRDLRITLRRAMEYFLLKRERDLLLKEKLSSLQQLLVADRVRSLAILAEGLSTQVRNTMVALQAYLQLVKEEFGRVLPKAAEYSEKYWRNVQWETEAANRHLLKVMQSVATATIERRYDFADSAELSELIDAAWRQARALVSTATEVQLRVSIKRDLSRIGCSRSMLDRMFVNLFRSILQPGEGRGLGAAPEVEVMAQETTRLWGAEGIAIELRCSGFDCGHESVSSLFMPVWALGDDEDAPDMLAAFFIAHHHGGTIGLRHKDSRGSGFVVTLPFSPELVTRPALDDDATEKLFTQLPAWEALEREA